MPLTFEQLQGQLRPAWGALDVGASEGLDPDGCDLLVVPSLSLDQNQIDLVAGAHHYEERQLFSLISLRHPGVQAVYLTSKLLPDLVVDAVLELLPGMPASHARRRLQLFDTDDASPRPLTQKLLERPALLERIRERLRPGRSFMTCFNVTPLEKELSVRLQVPLLGTDPGLGRWGSKAGSRELFHRCGVPHPAGSALVHDLDALSEATAALWEAHPELERVVVKLNEGFSGEGNAALELGPLQLADRSGDERRRRLRQALERLPMPPPQWQQLLVEQGALVEAWLQGGEALHSPSVQGMIHPGGQVEMLSTHEQILGGPNGQTYQGCRFPADVAYREALLRHGRAVGEALAQEGALERFAVDFIARRFGEQWDLQAIEVNLRKGGTTHPFMALRYATNGRIDPISGVFQAPSGQELCYVATDNLCDARLRGLLPIDLIDIVAVAGLHFDPAELRGSLFHLLGCLSQYGKLGMTCIGHDAAEASRLYEATAARLLQGAQALQRGAA